jgi:subtilase family serine protease
MNFKSYSKFVFLILSVILTVFSMETYAGNWHTPGGWLARPPYHLKPNTNTLLPSGLSPAQVVKAYGFPSNLQGLGQTIAIVDAMDNPNVESDLLVFTSTYGLPACTTANGCFKKLYVNGSTPAGDPTWGVEIALDVEWAHAIAPLAKILLIETPDASSSLYDGITLAIQNNATVISCSWGGAEFGGETTLDTIFQTSPVPVVVASGDSGAGVTYPAASPYVLSVGGTSLSLNANGTYASETAWSGSSGGVSTYETEPNFQVNFPLPHNPGAKRGVPDVSYHASPGNGFSIYDSYSQGGWLVVGGTSAGAPQWAALIAVANSAAGTNMTSANMPLYTAALSAYSTMYHDITSGQNGSCGYYCNAAAGYDYVTGLGSPKALSLISFLTTGIQILQVGNTLYNSEASAPGVTRTSALFQFYTGSSVLCDSRTLAYGTTITIQPGISGTATGHTTCKSNQKITSVTATPIITNAAVGAVFTASPVPYTVTTTSGILQLTLQLKPNDGTDYAPVFDATNGVIAQSGTAALVGV